MTCAIASVCECVIVNSELFAFRWANRRGRAAVKPQLRRPARRAHDLDVAPQHALRVAGAERLHRRFLRREPAGEMGRRVPAPRRVRNFAVGEDAAQKSIAVARDRRFDAVDFGRIHSDTDNIGRHVSPKA